MPVSITVICREIFILRESDACFNLMEGTELMEITPTIKRVSLNLHLKIIYGISPYPNHRIEIKAEEAPI